MLSKNVRFGCLLFFELHPISQVQPWIVLAGSARGTFVKNNGETRAKHYHFYIFFGWPSKKSHPKVIRVWVLPYWSAAASVWAPKCNASSVPRWHVLVDHFLRRFRIFIFKSKLHILIYTIGLGAAVGGIGKIWRVGCMVCLYETLVDDIQSVFSTPKVEYCYTMLLRESSKVQDKLKFHKWQS